MAQDNLTTQREVAIAALHASAKAGLAQASEKARYLDLETDLRYLDPKPT